MPYSKTKITLGHLALLLCGVIWGLSFVLIQDALDSIGALWLLAIRFGVSALFFILISARRLKSLDRSAVISSIIIGICYVVAYLSQTVGLRYTTAGKSAFLTGLYTAITPFLARLVYKRNPEKKNIIAAFICVIGIGFISLENGLGNVNRGDIYTIFCSIAFAFQIIIMEEYVSRYDAFALTTVQLSFTAVGFILLALLFEPMPTHLSSNVIFDLAYVAVAATAFTFVLEAWGMKVTPSTNAAVLMSTESLFCVFFSVVFFGEKVSLPASIGFALVFLSNLINEINPARVEASHIAEKRGPSDS